MAGSKGGLLRINNRNSLYEADLNKSLTAYQREHIFAMSSMEYEKQDLKRFLSRLYVCDSDKDPAAVK